MSAPILVGISGATGAIYGVELLRALKAMGQPAHLILSEWGAQTITLETDFTLDEVRSLADTVYNNKDLAAAVSSGSFVTRGMVIAPCSVKTLSGIANSFTYNLMIRAADVTLKERRPLVMVFREAPLHKGHLDLLSRAVDMGTVLLPPMPAFYNKPTSIDDIVRHTVGKILDQFGFEHDLMKRWTGP
ncbi:MAG: UbiX family flavin prenyltransferase [Rhodospirillales bacterium]|nr:UbiX family flavin prenyltransferase [Rhodospirillales bacterium]